MIEVARGVFYAMRNQASSEEHLLMRKFWLRVLLVLGMLWGGMSLVTLPMVFRHAQTPMLDVFAAVFNGATVLPACAMAFWRRRAACIWVSANAAFVLAAMVTWTRPTGAPDFEVMVCMAGSVIVASGLDWMELRRWPGALGSGQEKPLPR